MDHQYNSGSSSDGGGFAVPMLPGIYANQKMMPSTSSSTVDAPGVLSAGASNPQAAAVIRRRRYSTAKIQPTRIKKVMQSDEEIGRMVQSVPVSIGRAMEHFAEKFLQASAEATQYTSSKTLNPQHMKQAVLNNPHFAFLESIFKDVTIPPQANDATATRTAMTLKEQQLYQEQQNSDFASAILASAQLQMRQEQMKQEEYEGFMMNIPPRTPAPPTVYPSVQSLAATVPLSPSTPTTQIVNGMFQMLKCPSKKQESAGRLAGIKRGSTDGGGSVDEDKPKRGRPKKLKAEKCVDDELFEEASRNIAKEDKDRELMPPPALPIGRL
uniref:CBFD_NFYB_HMF domain-containing protein n=1 Tax=Caenorhabditis japonica TaxID=281687 RepID=A0A8R1I1Q4_CAEJA